MIALRGVSYTRRHDKAWPTSQNKYQTRDHSVLKITAGNIVMSHKGVDNRSSSSVLPFIVLHRRKTVKTMPGWTAVRQRNCGKMVSLKLPTTNGQKIYYAVNTAGNIEHDWCMG